MPVTDIPHFGRWLKAARKTLKVTQKALAEMIGRQYWDIKQTETYANSKPETRAPILAALKKLGYDGPPPPAYKPPKVRAKKERGPNTVAKIGTVKGAYKQGDKWRAVIVANKKQKYHLGTFDTKEEAALAYNEAAKKLHGDNAKLNAIRPKKAAKAAVYAIEQATTLRAASGVLLAGDDTIIRGF